MPQAVAPFIIAVDAFLVAVFGPAAAIFILDVGVQLAGLALLGAISQKLLKLPDINQTAKSNLLTVRGTLEHQRIVYGESLFSGPLWYFNAAGTHNQSMFHAVVVAGHEIEDITDIWLDDNVIDGAGGAIDWAGNGSVDSGWLAGDTSLQTTAYVEKKLGIDDQTASSQLSDDFGGAFTEITSQHQGRNIAYFVVRLDYFDGQTDVYSKGAPHNYKALVKGKKVYNPNSDSSQSWGTGPHRVNSAPTWEYSNDPALCWADYMIDKKLGFGEDPSRINYAYVASVYAINRTVIFTPVGTDYRFTCNGGLSTGSTYEANLSSILSAANMTMALIQGEWKLRGWEYETPVLAFGDDELRKDISIRLSTDEQSRYNAVRGSFIDKDRSYQAHAFPRAVSSEYYIRDNSETLYSDIQLPMTTDIYQAQRLAFGILEQSDLQKTVVYPSNFKTLPVEIGGTIMLSNTKMDWVDDTFRVTNYKLNDMQGVDLVLQEDTSAAYTDVGTAEYTVSSGGSYVTADPGVPEPTNLEINNLPSGILINWRSPPARLYDQIEIFRSIDSNWNNASLIAESRINNYLDIPVKNEINFYFLRSKNYIGEVSSYAPVGSSMLGLYVRPSMVLNLDPTFNQSKPGVGDFTGATEDDAQGLFWTTTSYMQDTSGGKNVSYQAMVQSEGTGTGSSQVMQANFFVGSDHSGLGVVSMDSRNWLPIVRGSGITAMLRYRVTSYSNISSATAFMSISGRTRLDQLGLTNIGGPVTIQITNSTDWIVRSVFLDIAAASNVGSFSYASVRAQAQINYVATDSGYFSIEFDDFYAFFNES